MPNINPSIFRAYDIRGTAQPTEQKPQPDLTPEKAILLGRGIATYLKRTYGIKNMLVGRDNRLHSEALQTAFIQGALDCQIDVIQGGLNTSPMIYFASCFYGYDSAINITASHNPKQDNGIKIVQKNAQSVADQEIQKIRQIIEAEDFDLSSQPGKLTENNNIATDYLNKIVSATTLEKPLKVVIDAGNGVAGAFAPAIFRALKLSNGQPACEVYELFCELDGNFPNHEANPEHAKNMIDLGEAVKTHQANLGIGFDGDGDRVGVVDQNGKHYSAEYLIMLLSKALLNKHPGEKIIHDVKVCNGLIEQIKQAGGQPIMSRVGHSYIERRLHDEQASFAGEKSGHLFFGNLYFNYYGFDDGIFGGVKVAEALSQNPQNLAEIFSALPENPNIPELKIPCPDERKDPIIEALKIHFLDQIAALPTDQKPFNCITLDGIRIQFPDGAWILARYSNTTPALTLHAEAPTPERLQEVKELVFDQLRQFPELKLPA